jgi:hypothetical protein
MKKIPNAGLIICLMCAFCFGQSSISGTSEQVGTSIANFLKIGIGAREVGMGGAAVASCDNITSLYWNAGALDRMDKNEIILQQTKWLVDTWIYYLAASYRLPGVGSFGLSMHYFSSGDIEETTLLSPDGTGRTFTADDVSIGVTYSRKITERFSTGITIKFIQESLDREKASTIALDIGSIFETSFLNNMRIGMSLSNLGGTMKFFGSDLSVQYASNPEFPTKVTTADLNTETWEIPLFFRFGVATEAIKNEKHRLTVSTEIMDSRDYIYRLAFGAEFAYSETVFLRGGYKDNYDEQRFTLGAGLKFNFSWAQLRLDYAYANFGVFDNTQRFSLIFVY